MIRTIIHPDKDSIQLNIPEEYIGKEVEILMFATEEPQKNKSLSEKSKKASSYKGILSDELADAMQQYIKQSREEWQ